jgi:membrane-associated phospholipid phosphatase
MPDPVLQGSHARTTLLFAALSGLVVLAYFFADRQLAGAVRPYLNGVPFFIWLTYIVKPLAPLASLIAVIVAAKAAGRHALTPTESALLRLACAILIAGVLTFELKEAFGRTWPETWVNNNPSFFGNGTYGFFPFHGGQGYASFPSGHTTAISALAGALWFLWPRLRWLGVALVLAVAVGLLGADYHWLSDIIAGGIVGGTAGTVAARIGRSGGDLT